jgi:hypothetical protein
MTTTTSLSKSEPQATALATRTPPSSLPPISIRTDSEAEARFNALTARVFLKEPLTTLFHLETSNSEDGMVRIEGVLNTYSLRTTRKLKDGGIIIEAGNWAAAAIWDPPGASVMGPPLTSEQRETQPIFCSFVDGIAATKLKYLGPGANYWHLSMMVRDPDVQPPVKGAVRAVIEPFMRKAEEDGLPIWIEAGSARARDVYGYLGFELLEEMRSGNGTHRADGYPAVNGEDAPGVPTWFMIYNKPRSTHGEANGSVSGV